MILGWFAAKWIAGKTLLAAVPRETWVLLAKVAALLLALWLAYSWAFNRGADSRDDEVAKLTAAITQAETDRDEWKTRAETAQEANATNQTTIADLRVANEKFAAAADTKTQAAAAAEARIASLSATLADMRERERSNRRALLEANDDAKRWAETPVPRVLVDHFLRNAGREAPAAPDRPD